MATWETPPTVSAGQVLPASDINDISGDLTVLETKIGLAGAGGTVTGTAPSVGTPAFYMMAGSKVTSSGSGGAFVVSYPATFPNGVLTAVAVLGTNTGAASGQYCTLQQANMTTSEIYGNIYKKDGTPATSGGTYRIDWIAIGF